MDRKCEGWDNVLFSNNRENNVLNVSEKRTTSESWQEDDTTYKYTSTHGYKQGTSLGEHERSKITVEKTIAEGYMPPEKQDVFVQEIEVSGPFDINRPPAVEVFHYTRKHDAAESTAATEEAKRFQKDAGTITPDLEHYQTVLDTYYLLYEKTYGRSRTRRFI